jgi:hypothetical protein
MPTVLRNRAKFCILVKPVHCNEARLEREKMVRGGGRVGFETINFDVVPILGFENVALKE